MSRKKYIDRTDIELLNVLKKNPGFTVAQLGDEVDLSPGPTHTRLINLGEEGFYKNSIEIAYERFGIEEHRLSIKLAEDPNQKDQFKPVDIFNKCVEILEKAKESLIISIELVQDVESDSYFINVCYFNRYSEKTIKQRDSRSSNKDEQQVSVRDEVKNLLSAISEEYTLNKVIEKKTEIPSLDAGHVIRKKPEA